MEGFLKKTLPDQIDPKEVLIVAKFAGEDREALLTRVLRAAGGKTRGSSASKLFLSSEKRSVRNWHEIPPTRN